MAERNRYTKQFLDLEFFKGEVQWQLGFFNLSVWYFRRRDVRGEGRPDQARGGEKRRNHRQSPVAHCRCFVLLTDRQASSAADHHRHLSSPYSPMGC
ncbi:unnamed protein product [Linum trigynum]|uniref:Uncharacterized protein n=1 Tax=Linum trigynum TaxID=586398 RepID=A0AAV2FMK0_9ROSI